MGKRRKSRRLQKKKENCAPSEASEASEPSEPSEPRGSLGRRKGGVSWSGDMSLIPPIRPPAINLSLKCQHVKFSSRMSA